MLIKATQKNTRQTPRKVRLVANQVRKMSLPKAIEQLGLIEKRPTLVILKTLRQALANASHNHGLKIEDLELDNILITEGPRYKRFRAVSRGRAHGVIKRTSHITVTLKTNEKATPVAPKKELKKPAKAEKVTEAPKTDVAAAKKTASKAPSAKEGVKETSKAAARAAAPKKPRTTNK